MKRIVSLTVMFLFVSSICFAQLKNYKVEGAEDIPSNKSQDEVVSVLINKLTKQAIEKSGIKLREYKLSKDEYNEFVKANTNVEVKNKKVFMKKGNQACASVRLNVQMDAEMAKNYLDDLQKEKEAKKEKELMDAKAQQELEKTEKDGKKIKEDKEVKEISTPVVSKVSKNKDVEDKVADKKSKDKKADKKAEKKTDKNVKKKAKEKEPVTPEVKEKTVVTPAVVTTATTPKEVSNKTSNVVSEIKTKKNISIDQALQEADKVKQETKVLLDNFDKSLKESESSDAKTNISETAISMIKPKIENLKSFQAGRFVDENADKAKILSMGTINEDEKCFDMKIIYLYQKEQPVMSNLKYDFSDIDIEQAKAMYNTPNNFVIEPLFSVEESDDGKVQRVLSAFNVKHTGLMREQTVKVSTKVKPFSEIIRIEEYEKKLNKKQETDK